MSHTPLVDCHVHTHLSGDASLTLPQVLQRAVELNLGGVCLTEHYDPAPTDPRMSSLNLQTVWERHLAHQASSPVALGVGLEVSYRPHAQEAILRTVTGMPFHVVIWSVHDVGDLYLKDWVARGQPMPVRNLVRPVLDLTARMVETGHCRVLGHLDYVKKYVPGLTSRHLLEEFGQELAGILEQLVCMGGVLELNLSGLRHPCAEPYPGPPILELYRHVGGRVVFLGSDAHAPEHLSTLVEGANLARSLGLRVGDWREGWLDR